MRMFIFVFVCIYIIYIFSFSFLGSLLWRREIISLIECCSLFKVNIGSCTILFYILSINSVDVIAFVMAITLHRLHVAYNLIVTVKQDHQLNDHFFQKHEILKSHTSKSIYLIDKKRKRTVLMIETRIESWGPPTMMNNFRN